MRDDSHKWDANSAAPEIFSSPEVTVTQITLQRQLLISGVNVLNNSSLPLVGWPGDTAADAYALVLRRDRILEINGQARADGWDEATGTAVSDMTDGYAVLAIEGEGALALLKRGAFVNPEEESRSVGRMLFGLPALLYQTREPNSYRVHVSSVNRQTLRKALLTHLENQPT